MSSKLTRLLRVLLSLSLVLWVSGIGCGLVCGNASMAAPHDHAGSVQLDQQHNSSHAVSHETSAMPAHHGCCAKHHGAATAVSHTNPEAKSNSLLSRNQNLSEPITLAAPEGLMNTCPLASNATALATGLRTGESVHAEAVSPIALPLSSLNQNPIPQFAPTYLNNRGHTYLRCCVFLI